MLHGEEDTRTRRFSTHAGAARPYSGPRAGNANANDPSSPPFDWRGERGAAGLGPGLARRCETGRPRGSRAKARRLSEAPRAVRLLGHADRREDGEVVLHAGYGFARSRTQDSDVARGGPPDRLDHQAIHRGGDPEARDARKVNTNDPISKYFPNVPADKGAITLHHLLIHGAGLESDYGDGDFEPVTREEIVRRVLAAPLRSTPGATYHYSNAGYSLLAAIVEQVSGKSHEEFLYENLWKPAGMEKTGFRRPRWEPGSWRAGSATGASGGRSSSARGGRRPLLESPRQRRRPLDRGRYVALAPRARGRARSSRRMPEKVLHPYIPEDGGESQYAYGWAIFETPRRTLPHRPQRRRRDLRRGRSLVSRRRALLLHRLERRPPGDRRERADRSPLFRWEGGAAADVAMPPEVAAVATGGAAGEKAAKLAGEYRLDSGARRAARQRRGARARRRLRASLRDPLPDAGALRGPRQGGSPSGRNRSWMRAAKGDTAPLCRAIGEGASRAGGAARGGSLGFDREVVRRDSFDHDPRCPAQPRRRRGHHRADRRRARHRLPQLCVGRRRPRRAGDAGWAPEAAFLPDTAGAYVAFDFWSGNTVTIAAASGVDAGSIEIVAANPKGAPLTRLRANRAR